MSSKPAIRVKLKTRSDLQGEHLEEFLERLPERYFRIRSEEAILSDAVALSRIQEEKGFEIMAEELGHGEIECRIYAFDSPGLFSLITGLLSATGFDITAGLIFTYTKKADTYVSQSFRGGKPRKIVGTKERPRKIIDQFTGHLDTETGFNEWKQSFELRMRKALSSSITESRRLVYEAVAEALSRRKLIAEQVLYPVDITVGSVQNGVTSLSVVSEDTPFFLFTLSNALSLHGFSIESVRISTRGSRIEDEIEVADGQGKTEFRELRINQIRLSVLLTKQFSYFLGRAPNPYDALLRFETITRDLFDLPSRATLDTLLSNPGVLQDLARLLGASDFLWEDFIRIQYENILPLLDRKSKERHLSMDSAVLGVELESQLAQAKTWENKIEELNKFKNREIYLIDLDHIVSEEADFRFLSKKLTALAETVVQASVELSIGQLTERYGEPTTYAGLPARYAIMGLGKLGGEALGYASDIELLFVYSDAGRTDGTEPIGNGEFFERVFKQATTGIEAKQEGIFHIDLRLRPHGNAGPIACSLDSFSEYYGPQGAAHSYEKLALVRMRAVGGDSQLGKRLERLRDDLIYRSDAINLKDLRDLREKQLEQKTKPRQLNAKFSPGGLVDLEYSVQIIQCRYGRDDEKLRTPRIHVALEELVYAGLLSGDEAADLVLAYHFQRKLINGLRMLRGSAKDLFLPEEDSDEFMHLARRMGYRDEGFRPSRRLHLEFETKTALVRSFIERRLGRDSLPGPPVGNAADLALSDTLPETLRRQILMSGGFRDIKRAAKNLISLRGEGKTRQVFARLAVVAWDALAESPDPDMALNNWERYAHALPSRLDHFETLLSQPRKIEILLAVFAGSQFLADTLARNPDYLDWMASPGLIHSIRKRETLVEELREISDGNTSEEWRKSLRLFRKREILRIGTRDICLSVPLPDIVTELSNLAEAIVEETCRRLWSEAGHKTDLEKSGFCVMAFGKLGGAELNYSSDLDLIAVFDSNYCALGGSRPEEELSRLMERLRSTLSDYTEDGYVYRIDYRLRPYGRSSLLAHSITSLLEYYRQSASLWEHQALLKLRTVAGDATAGEKFTQILHCLLNRKWNANEVSASIKSMRKKASGKLSVLSSGVDIKSGEGGIRDIEFLVQGLQMIHAQDLSQLFAGNTLAALHELVHLQIVPVEEGSQLELDYLLLRRIEHFLQLLEDRQVHHLPRDPDQQAALARRISSPPEGRTQFMERLATVLSRVHETYLRRLVGLENQTQ